MQAHASKLPSIEVSHELPPANILLVDDREQNLVALEAILQPLEQNLVRASSGFDALRQLLNHEFAAILMDVQMPGMDGFETVNLIKSREKTKHVPIIFITAVSTELKYVYRGYSTGAVDYISKPFNPEILRSKVSVFIDLYNKQNEILRQAELLEESIRREEELKRMELQREMDRRHLREVATKLESCVQERTRELTDANRDLESFCYSIAHDLRTPVREIMATSNFLLQDCASKLSEEDLANLKAQSNAARNMGLLIEDLLRLSRLGKKSIIRTPVNLTVVARTLCEKAIANRDNLELEIQDGVLAEADQGLVEILIQNLVENAVKYSPKGGKIRFGRDADNPQVFFLSDDGIGFDMQYERKVFLPFERLVFDPQFPGTGIGLALVQKIVSKHGGRVWAKSEPGKGSTFFFTLEEARGSDSPFEVISREDEELAAAKG